MEVAKRKTTKKNPAKKSAGKTAKKTARASRKKACKKVVKKTGGKKTVKKAAKKASRRALSKPIPKPKKAKKKKKVKITSPLSKKELKEYWKLLMEKRRSLMGDMSGIEAGTLGRNQQESAGDLSNMPTHPADIGSDNFEHEFTLGLLESERALLTEINEALERIQNKTYGVCLGTGDPIGKSRLRARPWCKYCIDYQKLIEKGLIHPGDEEDYGLGDEDEV